MRLALFVLPALATLAACGPQQPPTRATAERLCTQEARDADGISGSVGIGGGTGGATADGNLRITSDIFNPRNESDALRDCVDRRVGGQPNPQRGGVTFVLNVGDDNR